MDLGARPPHDFRADGTMPWQDGAWGKFRTGPVDCTAEASSVTLVHHCSGMAGWTAETFLATDIVIRTGGQDTAQGALLERCCWCWIGILGSGPATGTNRDGGSGVYCKHVDSSVGSAKASHGHQRVRRSHTLAPGSAWRANAIIP